MLSRSGASQCLFLYIEPLDFLACYCTEFAVLISNFLISHHRATRNIPQPEREAFVTIFCKCELVFLAIVSVIATVCGDGGEHRPDIVGDCRLLKEI